MIYDILQKFIVLYIVIFCLYMIFFYFKNKSKKAKNKYTKEMIFLTRIYGIDINLLGKKEVEKHIALINSFIVTTDVLVYFYMKIFLLKILIMFASTLLLVFISYTTLAKYYIKKLY